MPHRWSRRHLVQGAGAVGLGLLAGCGRLPWQAQAPARTMYRIGWLFPSDPGTLEAGLRGTFRQGLQELGYVEGENVLIEYRHGDDQRSQLAEHAAELAQLPVDVIVAAVASAEVAREVTSTIPIVMVYPADPVASGLVASIARPGGNVTGLTYLVGQLSQKRLGLLKETLPSLTRVAVLQEGDRPGIARDFQDMESAAQLLRVELQRLDVYDPGEFDAAFEAATAARADCLLLGGGGFFVPHRARLVELAAQHRLPAMYFTPTFVHVGGLMAYASDIAGQYRRAAYYVDRILKGTKPADLPVEQPMVFDFAINLRTAQALGLTIPHHVLLQATEVIQ